MSSVHLSPEFDLDFAGLPSQDPKWSLAHLYPQQPWRAGGPQPLLRDSQRVFLCQRRSSRQASQAPGPEAGSPGGRKANAAQNHTRSNWFLQFSYLPAKMVWESGSSSSAASSSSSAASSSSSAAAAES